MNAVLLGIDLVLVAVNVALALENVRAGNGRLAGICVLVAIGCGVLAVFTASTL